MEIAMLRWFAFVFLFTGHGLIDAHAGYIEAMNAAVAPQEPQGEPRRSRLLGAMPNPVVDATRLHYDLAVRSPVRLTLYDIAGRRVRTLVELPMQEAGSLRSIGRLVVAR